MAFDLELLSQPSLLARALLVLSASWCGACAKAPEAPPPRAATAAAPTQPAPPSVAQQLDAAAHTIDASFLRTQIAQLSSDAFEGRGPASKGDQAARAYLIDQLKALGLRPGMNGVSWEQPFDILGVSSKLPEKWTFAKGGKTLQLAWNTQFIAANGGEAPHVALKDAELVFVGYGIQAPEYQWDDFKGQDLKGKILLMLNNDPDWDPALFEGTRRLYYGRWTYKYESAARQGAAGAIIIHTTPSAGYPFSVVQSSWSGEQFKLPSDGGKHIDLDAWVTEDAARALVKLAGQDLDKLVAQAKSRDFKPVPLGVKTSLAFDSAIERAQTANVLGVLPGGDKADEYVIYTAHHDHLGIGKADEHGDAIYNGALDNAAGCAEVLAVARAFKALATPPRRSIMFLFVGAEEQGLLGSRYFAEHPTVPAGKIAVDVNFDGANIWGRTRDVTFIGKGKSTLDATLEQLAAAQGRTLQGDQFPDRGFYYRSDQFSFAKIGVPAIYLDTGTSFVGRPEGWGKQQVEDYEAHHYHQPSDQLTPEWSFDGMIEDAQLGFRAGVAVANQDAMPSWVPGDEFEAARKAAIAAAEAH
jgi:Zn-dependent M28 family amino/carboxypeptidase